MKMRKIIAVMAAVLMLLSILPMAVFAADAETIKYTISGYPAGTQYKAETHKLDDYLTVHTNTRCHFTSELRIYAPSGSVNGEVILASTREMTKVVLNAGNKASTLTVSTSPDNSTWTQHSTLSVASSYKDLSISNLPAGTKYIKLVNGSGQVRIKYITVSYAADAPAEPEVPSDCEHEWELISTTAATCTTAGEEYYECAACGESKTEAIAAKGHSYGEATETKAPDCTTAGEKQSTCSTCGDVKTEPINALGHTFVDGFCSECGDKEPSIAEYTINFGTADQRVSQNGDQQVWQNDAVTFTNNKAASTNAIVSNVNPVRLYANSEIIIECDGMTKIVFDCNNTTYAGNLKSSIGDAATVSSDKVTVTLDNKDSFTVAKLTAQVRLDSITVTAEKSDEPECVHNYVDVETQAPTCTDKGVKTYTCSLCNDSYTEAIDAKGHTFENDTCSACGVKKLGGFTTITTADQFVSGQYVMVVETGFAPTCLEDGWVLTGKPEIADGVIVDAASYLWTLTVDGDSVKITDANGVSIAPNGGDNNGIKSGDYDWKWSIEEGKFIFAGAGDDTVYLASNTSSENKFRGYKQSTCTGAQAASYKYKFTLYAKPGCAHEYDNEFDVDCNACGAIREYSQAITNVGTSAMEMTDGNGGVAALFNVDVEGLAIKAGTATEADYTNATIGGYKLLSMGAIASNGASQVDIPVVYMYQLDEEGIAYAIRVKNVPANKYDVEITFQSYFVIEVDGVATTIYGDVQTSSYNGAIVIE